ncbi:MAG: MBL fold metallo-hydrolase, partial [Pyrinomonadaceae bacterium]|nr:MBL fold metallo-hydrolase [Pyrinomonadaceae bacterium]
MRRVIFSIAIVGVFVSGVFAHVSMIKNGHGTKYGKQNFKLEKVNGNVHVLFGRGGNIGVSYGSDGLMTVDTQFANIVPQLKAELMKLGTDKPKFVFNTHYHGDHTGGNALFGLDGTIIAHYNVRKRLLSTTDRSGKPREPAPKAALPTITYKQGLSVFFNGEQVKAIHFKRGHTDGDTAIFFTGSNVVHLGDDFFVGRFPFVDLASGGSVQGLVKNIGKLVYMIPSDAKIIPGHGPIASVQDLMDYHSMLVETTTIVRKHMKEGKTLDQIKTAGFPAKYKDAGSGFINQD